MKNIKKILVFVMAMLLVMAISVGGTLAWLNAKTVTLTNTFVTGSKLAIKLDEAKVFEKADQDKDNKILDDWLGTANFSNPSRTEEGNEYKLVPGKKYDKDPKVTIEADSEDCFVFVQVVNTLATAGIEAPNTAETPNIEAQMLANDWVKVPGETNVWYYNGGDVVAGNLGRVSAGTVLDVFENFYIATNADVSTGKTYAPVTIQAYAVQAETITTPLAAWEASPLVAWQTTGN